MIKENVTILNLPAILEVLVDEGKANKDIKILTEKVRMKLASNICQTLSREGELQVLTLEPNIEHKLAQGIMNQNNSLVLEPKYEIIYVCGKNDSCKFVSSFGDSPRTAHTCS